MNNSKEENKIPKIYQITGLIAFIYSAFLLLFTIYKQFIYVDKSWVHSFIANGSEVLNMLIWIGILIVFKYFLNKILNYSKANLLINAYLIFQFIIIYLMASILYTSIKFYFSLDKVDFNTLPGFTKTTLSSAFYLFLSLYMKILICILLGNRIRKIDVVEKKLFQFLGFSFIAYGVLSLLTSINIIESDYFQLLPQIILVILIGLILKKTYNMNLSDLHFLTEFEKTKNLDKIKLKTLENKAQNAENKKSEKVYTKKVNLLKDESKKNNLQNEELPDININDLEDKDLALSYYDQLTKEELSRLEHIVEAKYNQNMTKEQIYNLVIQYIAEKKLYDHQRFLPK